MKATGFIQVTPHIYRYAVPFYGGGVAIWLVHEGDEWILIDAGVPGSAKAVIPVIEKLAGGPPSRIILTHGHVDHTGALQELVEHWNLPVWAHKHEVAYIRGTARYRDVRPANWQYRIVSWIMNAHPPGVPVARELCDRELIDSMQVIHVPGHAPGMIALLHHNDRALITGDAVTNLRGRLRQPVAIFTPDPDQARRSIHKLAGYDFDHMLISHSQPIFGTAKQQLQAALARPDMQLKR